MNSDTLRCKTCDKERPVSAFSVHPQCRLGYDTSRCKPCKKSSVDWTKVPLERKIFNRVKGRARDKGIPFNLELSDIIIPEVCPVFGTPFVYGDHSMTPSLDRIRPELGYVKGNVVVISNKANMMKSTATLEDVEKLYLWLKGVCEIQF